MVKATNSPSSRQRRKRVLKAAKGFYGNRSKLIRTAYNAVARAYTNAYIGRKQKKRQYRRLWTIRINAACRSQDFTYSKFINGLKRLDIALNRKVLADMAVKDPQGFSSLIAKAKAALN